MSYKQLVLFHVKHEEPTLKGVFSKNGAKNAGTNQSAAEVVMAASAALIQYAIKLTLSEGAALLVGNTRDGATVCVTLMVGNDRGKAYASTPAELEEVLRDVCRSMGATDAELVAIGLSLPAASQTGGKGRS